MKLIHRFGYYLSGLTVGIIILIFFLSGNETSCNYFPNDRVLSQIQHKPIKYSGSVLKFFNRTDLDTTQVDQYLEGADIDFETSKTHIAPCPIYYITSKIENKTYLLTIENCRDTAELQDIKPSKKN